MARLIDADKIINGIALYMAENAYLNDTPLDVLKMVANWITDAPTVDAVPVVRCLDCKHWDSETWLCDNHSTFGHHGLDWNMFSEDDFCSYGERKDGDK